MINKNICKNGLPNHLPHFEHFKPGEVGFMIDEKTGCWLCTSHKPDPDGYPKLTINGYSTNIHRQIYQQLYGPLAPGILVRHTCDNPLCINPAHLLTGTHADNVQDRVDRNRSAIGKHNGRAKLTEGQVKLIKRTTIPTKVLAQRFDVCPRTVRFIKQGVTWQHI